MSNTKHVISKLDGQKYCLTNGQFTRHLQKHGITRKEYYEIYISGITPLCHCMKPLTFYPKNNSYANSCGNPKCVGKNISITKQTWTEDQKKKDSQSKKRAFNNRTHEEIKKQIEKARKTFQERYNVEWGTQSEIQKNKTRDTKLKKYGHEYYSGWEKSSETNRNKSQDQKNEINERRRQTNLKRYGIVNTFLINSLNSSNIGKGNARSKKYKLPSGKIIGVRGYESTVLDKLLESHDENDLKIHDCFSEYSLPIFEYRNTNNRKSVYYPDIYIEQKQLIIEVKSQWWWNGNNDEKYQTRFFNNLRKRQAVINDGFSFQLWLFKNKYTYEIQEDDAFFGI